MDEPRGLVGIAWMVAETGLDVTTLQKAAARGVIPGATKPAGINRWLFDPALARQWLADGRPNPTQTTGPASDCYPPRPAPKPEPRERGRGHPSESTPLLVPIFKNAAHRGIHDLPEERQDRPTGRRRARTRKAALQR